MFKSLSQYIDFSFLVKFLVIFVPLYYFHIIFLGITDPKNFYSPFIDQHFNYIKWGTYSINYVASLIDHLFGLYPLIAGRLIYIPHGASVLLEFACLGLGITSFWIAFVFAHPDTWKNKVLWCLGGVFAIWLLNCWRIAILLVALQQQWKTSSNFDHHDVFNSISYVIIGGFIYLYYRSNKRRTSPVTSSSSETNLSFT